MATSTGTAGSATTERLATREAQETESLEERDVAKDPVCGMDVDEQNAAAEAENSGTTYYFCSPGCKATFEKDPAKYAAGGGQAS